ncbi:MAG: anthranilate phosphoribosyltransferase [Chloroflexi bacterium]|nr:anthranilate phosphoribosyltransferase [Chloroflexota bacterium]
MTIKEAIVRLVDGEDLNTAEAEAVMDEIMEGMATPAQIGSFLTALRLKGETIEEITGCARAMRRKVVRVSPQRTDLVDTCGTGGDRSGTFNISTTAAFVVAAAGPGVAKHGNRSVSSRSGSADLLEALGVNLNLEPAAIATCIDEVGIGFLFAPRLHPAMRHAIGPRREMGIRTVFNLLGPLTNPAFAPCQVMGVYQENLVVPLAGVLQELGNRGAMVVHGAHGMDELSTTGVNYVAAYLNGKIEQYLLDPQELGLERTTLEQLAGGTPEENARITRTILGGEQGARREVVLLNAAAALIAAGVAADFPEGLERSAQALDSGKSLQVLDRFVALSNQLETKNTA